jgi:hypothetical protein
MTPLTPEREREIRARWARDLAADKIPADLPVTSATCIACHLLVGWPEGAAQPLCTDCSADQAKMDRDALLADRDALEAEVARLRTIANEALDTNTRQDFVYLGERDAALDQLAHAVFWLLRAYDSGHRHGWESGPSAGETMLGLFTWLCNEGFDPTRPDTPLFVPEIRAKVGPEETRHA